MPLQDAKLFVDGRWQDGERTFAVTDKFTGEPVAAAHVPSETQIDRSLAALAEAAAEEPFQAYDRFQVLRRAADLLERETEALAELLAVEAGFPLSDGRGEIGRAVQTLLLSAEESKRLTGEIVPLEGSPGGAGRFGFTLRVPVGVVCAVTPFNAPVNTVVHKIAPALAAGNAVVLKPSGHTPLAACRLVELLLEAGLPPRYISLLHGEGGRLGERLVKDERVRYIAFTGSTEVGRRIQSLAGLRRTQMELGSIAATVVCRDADLDKALPKLVGSSFRKAGQVCTSIQLLFVHREIAAAVTERFVERASALKAGDPRDEATVVGPLISRAAAERVERWVGEAAEEGARIAAGGRRNNNCFAPTVLLDTTPAMRVQREEIFGPVVNVVPFETLDEVIARLNGLPFGLATGVFTRDLATAFLCARKLAVGGVHINETCSSRVDLMPYGGVRDSGFGREGPRYAAREMTEERMVSITS